MAQGGGRGRGAEKYIAKFAALALHGMSDTGRVGVLRVTESVSFLRQIDNFRPFLLLYSGKTLLYSL